MKKNYIYNQIVMIFLKKEAVIKCSAIAAGAIIALVCAYLILCALITLALGSDKIEKYFLEETGLNLNVQNAKTSVSYDFSIKIKTDELKIYGKNKDNPYLELTNPYIKIRLLPLIFKKLKISYFKAENLTINTKRDKNGVFDFEKELRLKKTMPAKPELSSKNIFLNSVDITLNDFKNNKITAIKSNNFKINRLDKKKLSYDLDLFIETKNTLTEKVSIATITSNANIILPIVEHLDEKNMHFALSANNIDFSAFKDYINEFSPVYFKNLSGNTNVEIKSGKTSNQNRAEILLTTNNLRGEFKYNNKISTFNLDKTSKLSAKVKSQKNILEIISADFKGEGISANLNGTINFTNKKNPTADIKTKIKNTDFIKLVNIAPAGLIEYKTDLVNELKKAKPHAILNGNLNIEGKIKQPNVSGELTFSDIYLFERPKNTKTAQAKCKFIGDKVNVEAFVPAPNNQFVKVNGQSRLYGKLTGDYEITSSNSVPLAFAHKYLVPVKRVIGFKLGPVPDMTLDGIGRIRIKTSGTIDDAEIYGKFSADNVSATLKGVNAKLQNGRTTIGFDKKTVTIDNTTARISDGNFTIKGWADDYNNIDIKVEIKDISAKNALDIAKSSDIAKPYTGNIDFIKDVFGKVNFVLYLKGKAKSLEGVDFLNELPLFGEVIFKNNSLTLINTEPVKEVNGKLNWGKDYSFDLSLKLKNSAIKLIGLLKPSVKNLMDENGKFTVDIKAYAKNLYFSDCTKFLAGSGYFQDARDILEDINFTCDVKADISGLIPYNYKKIDPAKLKITADFSPKNTPVSKNIHFNSGKYYLKNSKFSFENASINLFGANIYADGRADDIFKNPKITSKILLNKFRLDKAIQLTKYAKIPALDSAVKNFGEYDGVINADIKIKKNTPEGIILLQGLSAKNIKQNLPVSVKSGKLKINGQKLNLEALNLIWGNAPVYVDANVNGYYSKNPIFNVFVSTNLDESATDKIINPLLTYPIKLKGEMLLKSRIKGSINNYTVFSYLTIPQDSDITYMGANLGDTDVKRELSVRVDCHSHYAKINEAKYIKYIKSQNNKQNALTMLQANGDILSAQRGLELKNMHIFTQTPVTAKLFNIIFKKSVLKQGQFTLDLIANGNIEKPAVKGKINLQDINIPLYSTKISDMELNISNNIINALLKGRAFNSDIEIKAIAKNKTGFPVILDKLDIKSNSLSLSDFIEGLSTLPKNSFDIEPDQPIVFKPQDLIIKEGSAEAKEVSLYDIKAANLKAAFSNPEGREFIIEDMSFDMADGKVETKGSFDLLSYNFKLNSKVSDCDSNIMAKSFLNLENQIFGKANANIILTGKIPQSAQELKEINGKVNFSVNEGKMPKLGSIEYLIRAGNLIKSGLLGLTLNNLIEVLTPYKTGEFSTIKGNFDVADAKINNLEIFSKGKNLSLFLSGQYDIINDSADIKVLGRLSKNVSNLLGAIGNASLNTLISTLTGSNINKGAKTQIISNVNKIPLIELTSDDYRLFIVKILGRLNSNDYVKSFNWLN